MDVVFEVASEPYPLDERAATLMAESLRVRAAQEPGAEGTLGARDAPPPPVRDAIPDREAFAACVVATRNFRAYPMLVSSPSTAGTTLYPRVVE